MNDLELMWTDRINHTPKSGYNVCGIDDYEKPGEQLYLVKHFKSYVKAKAFVKQNKNQQLTIFAPDDL
jgi:hypothetical protein